MVPIYTTSERLITALHNVKQRTGQALSPASIGLKLKYRNLLEHKRTCRYNTVNASAILAEESNVMLVQ